MNISKGVRVKVKSYPKCSSSCKETCTHCIIDTVGKYTGRHWTPSTGELLYEVKYKKAGQRKHLTGVFYERELEVL
jgi:hypothetical protein